MNFFGNSLYGLVSLFVVASVASNNKISPMRTDCTGASSCSSSTISDDSVYCFGYVACYGSTVYGSSLVRCTGHQACGQSSGGISTGSGSIYCSGIYGCYNSKVTASSGGPIFCSGYMGCRYGTVTGSSSEILCDADRACQEATVTSATLNCSAPISCEEADISASSVLYASGEQTLLNANIQDTPKIYATGEKSLDSATISTDGVSSFELHAWGENSLLSATLYCYSGSTCNVYCKFGNSCNGLTYYCDSGATCQIACNDKCSDCPTITNTDFTQLKQLKKHLRKSNKLQEQRLVMMVNDDEEEFEDIKNKNEVEDIYNNNILALKQRNMIEHNENDSNLIADIGSMSTIDILVSVVKIFIVIVAMCQLYTWCKDLLSTWKKNKNQEYQYQTI